MVDFYKTGLENKNGNLFIGGVSVKCLAEKFGTPLYVINEQRIRENYERLYKALRRHYEKIRIHYAMKANSNLNILSILKSEDAWIDALSMAEARIALHAGFPKEKILFTGTSVTNDELKAFVEMGIKINIDSQSAFTRLKKITRPEFISFRINPEIGAGHHSHVITGGAQSKFGIWESDAIEAYRNARERGIQNFGIHMHIGSNILDVNEFVKAFARFMDIVGKIANEVGIKYEFIDIGGGLGVPYKPEQNELDLNEYANKMVAIFKNKIKEYKLGEPYFCIEPGRYIVGDTTVLLTRVNTIKQTPHKQFAGIDIGFNILLRPALYGSYHHILVDGKLNEEETTVYDVVGPICESGDIIAKERKMPVLEEGDLLAVLTAGAYGYSMSSNYNLRPRAAEVLVNNGKYELVREQDTFEKMVSQQIKASWLK